MPETCASAVFHRPCPDRAPRTGRGMTPVVLRPATGADSEFCYQLHKAAMGDYVAAIWGWDEQIVMPARRTFSSVSSRASKVRVVMMDR